jgi:hypothetical protein
VVKLLLHLLVFAAGLLASLALAASFRQPSPQQLAAAAAILAGTLLFLPVKPGPLHVFAHEGAHWLVAKLFRRRTSGFSVGWRGGAVEVESPNLWIALAPYILPLWVLLWIPCRLLAHDDLTRLVWIVIFGLLIGQHLAATWRCLAAAAQPDFKIHGRLASANLVTSGILHGLLLALCYAGGDGLRAARLWWQALQSLRL